MDKRVDGNGGIEHQGMRGDGQETQRRKEKEVRISPASMDLSTKLTGKQSTCG